MPLIQDATLPTAKGRRRLRGPQASSVSYDIEVVTPIFGGASASRDVDELDVIRAASVRGHLRFWWRALYAHAYPDSKSLFAAEAELWGRAGDERGGRSLVDLSVYVPSETIAKIDRSEVEPRSPNSYALWPARSEKKKGTPVAPRREAGTRFTLTIVADDLRKHELRSVVRAWILFGGYGGRTRRGLGSLRCMQSDDLLPQLASPTEFERIFGYDVFARSTAPATDTPSLAGASLFVSPKSGTAFVAWSEALRWLSDFRQGTGDAGSDSARVSGRGKSDSRRPSISNWPEADKLRHLYGMTTSHRPRYGPEPAWPRASLGLPIIGRFQTKARDGGIYHEPPEFELNWVSNGGELRERLASPLILKALPLADGSFVSCALWLHRAYPNGNIIVKGRPDSQAQFDRILASDERPQFLALAGKAGMKDAFLSWLRDSKRALEVLP